MARMVPADINLIKFMSALEKKVYEIFSKVLPDDYTVWYNPKINSRLIPDFVIISPSLGVIIIEVKGMHFYLNREVEVFEKTQNIMIGIIEKLKKDEYLGRNEKGKRTELNIAYGYGIIIPGVTREQYYGEQWINERKNVVLKDDLDYLNGKDAQDRLISMLQDMISNKSEIKTLSRITINRIKRILFKDIENNDKVFRLLSLKVKGEKWESYNVDFSPKNADYKVPYTTVIIGSNGTGKSRLLAELIGIFREIEECKVADTLYTKIIDKKDYKIIYKLDDDYFFVEKMNDKLNVMKNNSEVPIFEIEMPKKVLATSFMLNDKFPLAKNNVDLYSYLGIRDWNNGASTNSFRNKLALNLLDLATDEVFRKELKYTLEFVHLLPKVKVYFNLQQINRFFRSDKTIDEIGVELEEYINSNPVKRKSNEMLDNEKNQKIEYLNHIENLANLIVLINKRKEYKKNKKVFVYDIDLTNGNERDEIDDFYQYLLLLIKMNILSSPKIILYKTNEFLIEDASSGEQNLIFNIINILCNTKHSSLILIDEPEISLHPNWQIKYIYFLKQIFKNFDTCHFIIATHSHFLISDLDKQSSSIMVLENTSNSISSRLLDENTFGWSAENVLYNVFGLATNRNYYLADEIDYVLKEISRNNINEELKYKVQKFKEIEKNLKLVDPLKHILQSIILEVENNA